jgi:hypothetical protein
MALFTIGTAGKNNKNGGILFGWLRPASFFDLSLTHPFVLPSFVTNLTAFGVSPLLGVPHSRLRPPGLLSQNLSRPPIAASYRHGHPQFSQTA